jgi:hypothetical protein
MFYEGPRSRGLWIIPTSGHTRDDICGHVGVCVLKGLVWSGVYQIKILHDFTKSNVDQNKAEYLI